MRRGPSMPPQVAPAPLVREGSKSAREAKPATAAADLQDQLTIQRSQLRTAFHAIQRSRVTFPQILRALNHWGSWVLVVTLVASQFACIFWSSQTTKEYIIFGQDPTKGTYHISGYNDEPYSDRSLVCVRQGRLYQPLQLSAVMKSARAEIVDTTGVSISGYRVVSRDQIALEDSVSERYALACGMIAATLPAIVDTCQRLGYKPVQPDDDLHVVHGVFSDATSRVRNSLPVLIMPFWDNGIFARYAIPGLDGSACMIHLSGLYDTADAYGAWLRASNRTVRESRTAQWLGIRQGDGAVWRNGWLEDPSTGQRWCSAMWSSVLPSNDKYKMIERQFDVLANREIDCLVESLLCHPTVIPEWWGDKFYSTTTEVWGNSVAISNGTRFGLFLYEAMHQSTIFSVYDVATLISNTTLAILLFRWFAATIVLLNAYRRGYSRDFSTPGIGCLAYTRNFELLPLLLLPRMTTALAAFFTAGCAFEGEQRAISEAWFVIYPALAEVMLYYYSLLNLLAKLLRRRMSDELFGPSLVFLCLLHWLRRPLANSGLFEFDGRVATVMTAKEYEKLRLTDFFTTNAAFRLNGNVWSIFSVKLVVLAVNLLPLVVAKKMQPEPWVWAEDSAHPSNGTSMTAIERALGVRASDSSGLGVSLHYREEKTTRIADQDSTCVRRFMTCYELVRLGYVVFGDLAVIPMTDWLTLVLFAFLRSPKREINFRVLAFRLLLVDSDTSGSTTLKLESRLPTLYQINDPLLLGVSVWDVTAVPLA